MAEQQQNFENHVRYFPLFHFVVFPLLVFNLIWQSVRLYQEPSWDRAQWVLMALTFIVMILAARMQSLRAQDRVIRLEERLRYQRVLSPELASKLSELNTGEIIALRFASDAELGALGERVLNGEFAKTSEIKRAIKEWRADHLRV